MASEQHNSRRYINLDWADVEAWVKSRPRTDPHPRLPDRYITPCPVCKRQSRSNDLNVWKRDNGSIGLTCRGNCTYRAMLEAIDNAINNPDQPTPPPQVETPPAAGPLTVAAIESHWPAVIQLLRRGQTVHERNVAALLSDARVTGLLAWTTPAVRALLSDARVTAVQADEVTLEFEFPFHAEQVEKPENRLVTEKALQQVLGRPLRVRAAVNPKKEIKPSTAPETKDQYDQELEQALATAQAEHAQELEQAVAAAKAEHAQELEQALATAQAGHAQELEQALAAAKAERDQELEQALATAQAEHAQELEQALAAAKAEHAQALEQAVAATDAKHAQELKQAVAATKNDLESRIEGLESKALTFDFIAAWGNLEDALEPLKKDLIQDYQHSGQSYSIAERRASITSQLDKALQEDYIDEDQCLDLKNMYTQRNNIAHRGHPLTSKLARAYLEILLPVIDRLRPAKASSQDLERLKAHYE